MIVALLDAPVTHLRVVLRFKQSLDNSRFVGGYGAPKQKRKPLTYSYLTDRMMSKVLLIIILLFCKAVLNNTKHILTSL